MLRMRHADDNGQAWLILPVVICLFEIFTVMLRMRYDAASLSILYISGEPLDTNGDAEDA